MVGLCPGVDVKAGCIPNIGTPHVLPSLSCMLTKMYGHGAMPHDNHIPHFNCFTKICLIAFAALKTVLQPGCWEVLKLDHPHHTTFLHMARPSTSWTFAIKLRSCCQLQGILACIMLQWPWVECKSISWPSHQGFLRPETACVCYLSLVVMISLLKISKRNLHGSSRFPFVLCHVQNPKWTQTPASTMCIMTCSAAIQHFKKESLRRSERTKTTLSGMLSAQLFCLVFFFFLLLLLLLLLLLPLLLFLLLLL